MQHVFHVQFPGLGLSFLINRVAFTVGGYKVYWYGIVIALGFLLAVIYAMRSAPKFGLKPDPLMNCILLGILFGVLGARVYYVIFYPGDTYRSNPSLFWNIHDGGLAIYGGVIGGLLAGCVSAKLQHIKISSLLDIASLGFLIGQTLGRWGNFFNQEAFGTQTNLPWGMMSENTHNVTVHPCFLYESIWCLLGFVLLHFFSRKLRRYDGQIFLLYLLWYGAERFVVEGLRTDSLLISFPGITLRVSQVLAGLLAVFSAVLLVVLRNRTVLSGEGSPRVMAINAIVDKVPEQLVTDAVPEIGAATSEAAENNTDITEKSNGENTEEAPADETAAQPEKANK